MTDNVAVVLQAVTKCLGDEVQTVRSANSEYYVTRPAAMTGMSIDGCVDGKLEKFCNNTCDNLFLSCWNQHSKNRRNERQGMPNIHGIHFLA